jgi:hypothetical protein
VVLSRAFRPSDGRGRRPCARRTGCLGADWTATVAATGFTTGNGTAPETIPAGDARYDIAGLGATTGSATFNVVPQTNLSGDPQAVVSATNVGGDTSPPGIR